MSTKIGHFEILSELARSTTGAVYKANDPKTGQTVALKTIQLSAFGESAAELEKSLLAEAEATKVLSHSNVLPVTGAGEIDGQFCAAMEYIQGNSIATMLARKEGFSIWDLLDIGRQVCGGFEHANSHQIFHYSLEPAKIMCGWDGMVRVMGYGVTGVGKFTAHMPGPPSLLHYMSPEQIRGEEIDIRANLFSLGTIFYEMVTDRKAFDCEDAAALRQSVLESTPVPPMHLNPKLHPLLSDLIMKAMAKDPAERYQSGRELLDDLEKCKETKPAAQKTAAPKGTMVPDAVKAVNQAKFIQTGVGANPAAPAQAKPAVPAPRPPAAPARSAVAAASAATAASPRVPKPAASPFAGAPKFETEPEQPSMSMSTATLDEPEVQTPRGPKIAVDPMMAGDGASQGGGVSFSDMTELPPLKEIYTPPPPPPQQHSNYAPAHTVYEEIPEKPKVQPREVAEKAMKEIKNVPPRLMVYSIAGAAVVILIIAVWLVMHVNTLNNDGDTPRPAPEASSQTAAKPGPVAVQPPAPVQPEAQAPAPTPEVVESAPARVASAAAKGKNAKKKIAAAAPVEIPGQISIDSTPEGAQVQVDGKTDPAWVTPFILPGMAVGEHTITVSKSGYSSDTHSVDVASGGKSTFVAHLNALMATLVVSSTPAGASVFIDGKNTGKVTPAQVSIDKGQHVVLVRKAGYIDETTSPQFVLGQTFNFSPALRALGNVDDIRTTGKMKKLFGGKDAQGMGAVSVKTQPKGAQVAVNQHMLDKTSPVDFVLDPGNYIVDITLTGYAPIHKIVTVDKGGKVVIDENLQHE